MDIIQRNLFRLLRSGAFHSEETIEPMSAFKWGRLLQLSVMHNVTFYAYDGIGHCRQQFFLRLTARQEDDWKKAVEEENRKRQQDDEEGEDDELLRPDRLTNPLLNRRLQDILNDEHSDIVTRRLLLIIIRIVRHLLNEGIPIRLIAELGIYLRQNRDKADFERLGQWLQSLRLASMAQLAGELLILLYGFDEEEIPFIQTRREEPVERIAQELVNFTDTRSQDWYFTQQDGGIFVHSSNSSAAFSHVRRSARYFRYCPSESVTNFFASFVHSLSHIEE